MPPITQADLDAAKFTYITAPSDPNALSAYSDLPTGTVVAAQDGSGLWQKKADGSWENNAASGGGGGGAASNVQDADGEGSIVIGDPEDGSNTATGPNSVAFGSGCDAAGTQSFAGGENSGVAEGVLRGLAFGDNCQVTGHNSQAMGAANTASGNSSQAFGNNTQATADMAFACGSSTAASQAGAFASGTGTIASGNNSHTEGQNTAASGGAAHAEGLDTIASGTASHAEGYSTEATQDFAHAEGDNTSASGQAAHAEGKDTSAAAEGAHAEGFATQANHSFSHASGKLSKTRENFDHVHASGAYFLNGDTQVRRMHLMNAGGGAGAGSFKLQIGGSIDIPMNEGGVSQMAAYLTLRGVLRKSGGGTPTQAYGRYVAGGPVAEGETFTIQIGAHIETLTFTASPSGPNDVDLNAPDPIQATVDAINGLFMPSELEATKENATTILVTAGSDYPGPSGNGALRLQENCANITTQDVDGSGFAQNGSGAGTKVFELRRMWAAGVLTPVGTDIEEGDSWTVTMASAGGGLTLDVTVNSGGDAVYGSALLEIQEVNIG